MEFDLALIWGLLIALAVFLYVVLDGFDLGIGILFPWLGSDRNRDVAMNSIAPVWDGNETWLVLGGGGLFAAFPKAYSILLTAFYAPLIAMLLALIFRGVAFEFRFKAVSARGKAVWSSAFWAGSTLAALCQGIMLGAFIQGIYVRDGAYAGGWFDWLTPFTLLTGAAVVAGYAMQGAGWLAMKGEGDLRERAFRFAARFGGVTVAAIVLVSIATPFVAPSAAARWFSWPHVLYSAPAPLAVAGLTWLLFTSIVKRRERTTFFCGLGLFAASYGGFAISKYPYLIPPAYTFREVAADPAALAFLLPGALVLLPVILGYTAYAYWVFRGKTAGEGYH